MVRRVAQPDPNKPIVDSIGSQSEQMRVWTRVITNQALIIGSGNPEGIVEAEEGATYQDNTGTAGNIRYAKRDTDIGGDRTKGWVLV